MINKINQYSEKETTGYNSTHMQIAPLLIPFKSIHGGLTFYGDSFADEDLFEGEKEDF